MIDLAGSWQISKKELGNPESILSGTSHRCIVTERKLGTSKSRNDMYDYYFRILLQKSSKNNKLLHQRSSNSCCRIKSCVRSRINALSQREFDNLANIPHRNKTYLLCGFMMSEFQLLILLSSIKGVVYCLLYFILILPFNINIIPCFSVV